MQSTLHIRNFIKYIRLDHLIESGSVEAHFLQHYGQAIVKEAFPLLLLLSETDAEFIPLEWIENVATEFTALTLINEAWMSAKDEYIKKAYNLNQFDK